MAGGGAFEKLHPVFGSSNPLQMRSRQRIARSDDDDRFLDGLFFQITKAASYLEI